MINKGKVGHRLISKYVHKTIFIATYDLLNVQTSGRKGREGFISCYLPEWLFHGSGSWHKVLTHLNMNI